MLRARWPRGEVSIRHVFVEETGEPEPGPFVADTDLPEQVKHALINSGVERFYKFQWDAIRYILDGYHTVITAGTGTGKTEAFLTPILVKIVEERRFKPNAILVYPTKALARDQLTRINKLIGYGSFSGAVYDGDTPRKVRQRIASNPPDILVTNPDMIHVGLVLSPAIKRFLRTSMYMVFDELHVYEGVFGSHVRAILERVKKFRKGYPPLYIGSSATIGNPKKHGETLFGVDVKVVEGPRRRRGKAYHVVISAGKLSRWTVTASLAALLAKLGLKVLVFTDSQQMAELVARIARRGFSVDLMVHRAGLPAEERRMVEQMLRMGEINGVVATPTLELGIDIGVLDAVIMASPPPSYAKYLQRAGRAGRRGKTGYIFLVLADDPIDAYYERRPERYYNQEVPPIYLEPDNEEVLRIHLLALLLQTGRLHRKELQGGWMRVAQSLIAERLAVWVGPFLYPVYREARKVFMKYMSIRGSGPQVSIIDVKEDKLIGYRELPQAVLDLHPDAIYLSFGKIYRSIGIDLAKREAKVIPLPDDTTYYTRPLYTVDLLDYETIMYRTTSRGLSISYARVVIDIVVEGYVIRNFWQPMEKGYKNWLDTPIHYSYPTRAILIKYPENQEWDILSNAEAFHAIEHALISAARPVCGAALGEMGGISYPSGDIVIYDAAPGGSGLARLLYERFEKAEEVAYEILTNCDCEDGCPRCIYSPYCGNNNQILSRRKATYILYQVLKQGIKVPLKPIEQKYGNPIV